jgi:hypothetical protein
MQLAPEPDTGELCEMHNNPPLFICRHPDCGSCAGLCSDPDCLRAHSHAKLIMLVPIE